MCGDKNILIRVHLYQVFGDLYNTTYRILIQKVLNDIKVLVQIVLYIFAFN